MFQSACARGLVPTYEKCADGFDVVHSYKPWTSSVCSTGEVALSAVLRHLSRGSRRISRIIADGPRPAQQGGRTGDRNQMGVDPLIFARIRDQNVAWPRPAPALGAFRAKTGPPRLENPPTEGDNAISPARIIVCVRRTSRIPSTTIRLSTASGPVRRTPMCRNTSGS